MIRNNLSILMSERNMKNSVLSLKTGISKNTISSTAKNDGKMIQLETINKICQVLDVTPNEFFSYLPYDLKISSSMNNLVVNAYENEESMINKIIVSNLELDIFIQVLEKSNVTQTFEFECTQKKEWNIMDPFVYALITIDNGSSSDNFPDFWDSIPTPFQTDIKREINWELTTTIVDFLEKEIKEITNHNFLEFGNPDELLNHFSIDIESDELGSASRFYPKESKY